MLKYRITLDKKCLQPHLERLCEQFPPKCNIMSPGAEAAVTHCIHSPAAEPAGLRGSFVLQASTLLGCGVLWLITAYVCV